jgi:replicative DNA helicase
MKMAQAGPERVTPQNLEAEMAVLGSILLDREVMNEVTEVLGSEGERTFYSTPHQRIYRALMALYTADRPIDLVTVTEELRRQKELENVGGAVYLTELLDGVGTTAHAGHYARLVQDKYLLRRLIQTGTQIVAQAYEGGDEVESLMDRAEQMIFSLKESKLRQGFVPIGEVLKRQFDYIQDLYDQKHLTGLETGLPDLDGLLSGFQDSDLVVVAGRPSMGKTALALNIAEFVAVKRKLPVAIFSLEMSKEQLVQRMLCTQARVDAHKLRTGFLAKSHWRDLSVAASALSEAPIYIDDTPAIPILEMRAKARRLRANEHIRLLIVDYLQLIRGPDRSENRQQEISEISRSLKALAKELRVPVVALSQLSRAVETRGGDRRPVLSDLRESGAIEQDADVVVFVYRPEVYDPTTEAKGEAQLIVAKQRNGPTGLIDLTFISSYTKFEPRATEQWSPEGAAEEEEG